MKFETINGMVFELKKGQAVMQDKSNLITLSDTLGMWLSLSDRFV